jgi:hypothetical protein
MTVLIALLAFGAGVATSFGFSHAKQAWEDAKTGRRLRLQAEGQRRSKKPRK